MSHCTYDYHQDQNKKSEWDVSDNGVQWTGDDFFKAKKRYELLQEQNKKCKGHKIIMFNREVLEYCYDGCIEKDMKYWENAVCSHNDNFHADCFACGFKFCKTHLFFAKERDESVEKAREEERDRILAFISEEFKDEEWTEDVVSFVKNNYKYHEPVTNH